jgi:phosphatidate cytidylyltransferase
VLRQRAISAVGVVAVALVPALFGGPVFIVAVLIFGLAGLHELLRALSVAGATPFRLLAFTTLAGIILAVALDLPSWALAAFLTAAVLLPLAATIRRVPSVHALTDWALTVAGTLYLALPLAHFVALRDLSGQVPGWLADLSSLLGSDGTSVGLAWFALALSVTWLTDSAAFLVGRRFGGTKLMPEVSPGKTRVGAAAGLVAGLVTGAIAAPLFAVPISWYLGAAVGLVLAGVGQVGDLAESLIKRQVGVKDMGSSIPGHGGVLDRIDALLFALPTAYYLASLLGEAQWS